MSKPGWRNIPIGGMITEAGSAFSYHTGDWRTFRPEVDEDKCTDCLLCWIHCPDSAIAVKDGKRAEFDFAHCKGCGICAEVCPVDCIEMKKEESHE